MISFEGTLQGESSGWHFSGYSFVATDKRVTRLSRRNRWRNLVVFKWQR